MYNENHKCARILAIDDDEDHLRLLQNSLNKFGYQVLTSTNGKNVLDIIFTSKPCAILLDLQMNGMDGRYICTLLKFNDSTSDIPIIIFSSNPDIKNIALRCGADGFISKGAEISSIKAEIARVT